MKKLVVIVCLSFLLILGKFLPIYAAAQENVGSNLFNVYGADAGCSNELIANNPNFSSSSPLITEDNPANRGILGVIISAIDNALLGCIFGVNLNGTSSIDNQNTTQNIAYGGGIISSLGKFSGALYDNPPTSLAYQVSNTISRISPVKSALAQQQLGSTLTGSGILQIISTIHNSVKDLVFVFYFFVFVAIAFAIIFRNKLGGQQYVSLVNSIPRILVSLILVVFSYSISGLVLDVTNVGMRLVYDVFVNQIEVNITGNIDPVTGKANPNDIGHIANSPKTDFVKGLSPYSPTMSVLQIFGFSQATVFDPKIGVSVSFVPISIGSGVADSVVSSLTGVIMTIAKVANIPGVGSGANGLLVLVMAVAAFTSMFKLFFALLKDFVTLLFYPIIAPVQFALFAIPGQGKAVFGWFKTMLGSALSFVAVYAVFMLIVYLGRGLLNTSSNEWTPPLLGFSNTPDISFISSLAAFGLFIIAPGIPDMVKGMLNVDASVSKFGSQIAETTRKAASTVTLGLIK